ncbi:hypothetical protein RF55_7682, partial [Lasius niger]
MAYLGRALKEDLVWVVKEFGVEIPDGVRVPDLKKLLLEAPEYEEELAKEMLNERQERRTREHEMKLKEIECGKNMDRDREEKGFSGVMKEMKELMLEPPDKAEEWPFFFRHIENMFKYINVPDKFKGRVLMSTLKNKVKAISSMLTFQEWDDYDAIKEAVLKEFRITPLQHKENFDKCIKKPGESYTQYMARLN